MVDYVLGSEGGNETRDVTSALLCRCFLTSEGRKNIRWRCQELLKLKVDRRKFHSVLRLFCLHLPGHNVIVTGDGSAGGCRNGWQ